MDDCPGIEEVVMLPIFLAMQHIVYVVQWHHSEGKESEKPERFSNFPNVMQFINGIAET